MNNVFRFRIRDCRGPTLISDYSGNCQALCPFFLSLKKMDKNWHWSHFSPHPPPPPTRHQKTFFCLIWKYGKNKTFLLRCYGTNFALIKRYRPFCFLWLYIRRHRFSLPDLCQLSVCVCLFYSVYLTLTWLRMGPLISTDLKH